jgi:hypothetical protein
MTPFDRGFVTRQARFMRRSALLRGLAITYMRIFSTGSHSPFALTSLRRGPHRLDDIRQDLLLFTFDCIRQNIVLFFLDCITQNVVLVFFDARDSLAVLAQSTRLCTIVNSGVYVEEQAMLVYEVVVSTKGKMYRKLFITRACTFNQN